METYENVTVKFVEFPKGAEKNDNGERTAKFAIGFGTNEFGIKNEILAFAKTAKAIKKGAQIVANKVTCRTNDDGYRWINSIQ
jgi:hypothetical protein